MNGITVLHKRPDEISQILVRDACACPCACACWGEGLVALPGARMDLAQSPWFFIFIL